MKIKAILFGGVSIEDRKKKTSKCSVDKSKNIRRGEYLSFNYIKKLMEEDSSVDGTKCIGR